MPFTIDWFPYPTPIDPSEDAPTSIDPLGLTTPAERFADLLVPGFTVRTWRARMITLSAVAAHVADGVVRKMSNRDEVRVLARLVFERLYVAAVARSEKKNAEDFQSARRGLPGITLARRAIGRNEPLSKNNFLKGQAVNGPVGVSTRLAKNLHILTADVGLGSMALDLLRAWEEDEELPGVLDLEAPVAQAGAAWLDQVVRLVADNLSHGAWPREGSSAWDKLLSPLRLDKIGKREKALLRKLLERDAARGRLFELLRSPGVMSVEKESQGERGSRERTVLKEGVLKVLGQNSIDNQVKTVIEAIERYEHASALLTQGFEALLWGLTRHGRMRSAELLSVSQVSKRMEETRKQVPAAVHSLDCSRDEIKNCLGEQMVAEPLIALRDDLDECAGSTGEFLDMLLSRHERVQKAKHKGVWIDRGQSLTLLPGFGIDGEAPPQRTGMYLHPFRITNSYSMLADLGLLRWKANDEDYVN